MEFDHSCKRSREAAVAIICDCDRLLTIKRSETVRAPGEYCFPGGGIEGDETVEEALVREMREELNVLVNPVRSLWSSKSPSGIKLFWWIVELRSHQTIRPNPDEVASFDWLTLDQIRRLPKLLASNVEFLASLERGEFRL